MVRLVWLIEPMMHGWVEILGSRRLRLGCWSKLIGFCLSSQRVWTLIFSTKNSRYLRDGHALNRQVYLVTGRPLMALYIYQTSHGKWFTRNNSTCLVVANAQGPVTADFFNMFVAQHVHIPQHEGLWWFWWSSEPSTTSRREALKHLMEISIPRNLSTNLRQLSA